VLHDAVEFEVTIQPRVMTAQQRANEHLVTAMSSLLCLPARAMRFPCAVIAAARISKSAQLLHALGGLPRLLLRWVVNLLRSSCFAYPCRAKRPAVDSPLPDLAMPWRTRLFASPSLHTSRADDAFEQAVRSIATRCRVAPKTSERLSSAE
jgi:hypothetical protein